MSEKFTPGPWKIDIRNTELVVCGSNHLMTVVHRVNNWDNSEQAANAHLISSAPELFEALNLAVMMIEQGTLSYSDTMDNLRLMKAVLNKARGIPDQEGDE